MFIAFKFKNMLTQDIKHGFERLSRPKKVVLVASVLTALSCLFPWYHDLSVYGVGDTYLGINGPLFLAGIFILAMNSFLALSIALPMIGKRFVKIPLKSSVAGMLAGLQSLFLLLIVNSVFYHAKFGVSISNKSPGFGMTIAMLAVLVLIGASYFLYKEESASKGFDEEVGRKEPLIRIPETPIRQHESIATKPQQQPSPQPLEKTDSSTRLMGFGFKEYAKGKTVESLLKSQKEEMEFQERVEKNGEDRGKLENMRIRMDL
jgi:hypothetical protein